MSAPDPNPTRVELQARGGVLNKWNVTQWDHSGFDSLKFSHGLAGVDQDSNYLWVNVLLYMFIGLGCIALILRVTGMWVRHMRHISVLSRPDRQAYWAMNQTTWWPWLDRHLFEAPLIHKRHNKAFQLTSTIDNGTLPGRWHTIVLIIYFGLNIAWTLILPYHEKNSKSVVAALRGRSGMLAALNLIPTVLFALRNNPLIPLLHISYDDFNLYHRWCARVTVLEAIVHTGAWLHNTSADVGWGWKNVYQALTVEASYGWGMVSTVAFTILVIQAWSPFRHTFYETFLNIHRLMIVASFVGLYLHLEKHHLPQVPWMQLTIFFYCAELFLRTVRITYHGFSFKTSSKITVEALPGEAVRVTVDLVRPWMPRPGCNAHIYMPSQALWSSHPFSIAWSPPMDMDLDEKLLPTTEGEVMLNPSKPRRSNQVSFICRARTGFTRKIYEKAAKAPSEQFTTFGFMEGPYGGHHSLDSYGTVLLFAGGVGITHQVMYIRHLVEGHHFSTTATQKIVLIWTVPDAECLEWVRPWMDEILRMPGRKKCLRVMLFISRPKNRIENNSETVRMFAGRPKTATLLAEEVKNRVGAVAVTVCGSGPFADDVRAAVRPQLTEGVVDFIEEAFTY